MPAPWVLAIGVVCLVVGFAAGFVTSALLGRVTDVDDTDQAGA